MSWEVKLLFVNNRVNEWDGGMSFHGAGDAMNFVETIYEIEKESLEITFDNDLNFVDADGKVYAEIEMVKEDDEDRQLLMFDSETLPDKLHRFNKFDEGELWLMWKCLNTTTGGTGSVKSRLIHEIEWQQRIMRDNKPEV